MAISETAPARRRAPWVRWGRLIVSLLLLGVLIAKFNGDDLVPAHRSLPGALAFLISGVVIMGASFLLASWRWQRVLAVFDAVVPLRTLFKHYLAAQFVGNALPSTVGGDVVRVARASNTVGSGEVSFGSVVLERLTGFVALPVLVFAGFALQPSLADRANAWIALLIAALFAVATDMLTKREPRPGIVRSGAAGRGGRIPRPGALQRSAAPARRRRPPHDRPAEPDAQRVLPALLLAAADRPRGWGAVGRAAGHGYRLHGPGAPQPDRSLDERLKELQRSERIRRVGEGGEAGWANR